jgi:cytochrome P450
VASATALILALASHPNVQKIAQAEIDNVVGQGRLPVITDRPSLPYVHAIVKELGRWHTVAPLGITHTTDSDDEYDGYFIPRGTFVMANSWAIMHDPDMFEQPFDFVPERYLKDGKITELVPDPEVAAFGFGRR